MEINSNISNNAKVNIIVFAIFGFLLVSGITVINFMGIFSENWFIGLGLLLTSIATIAVFIVIKLKK